MKNQNKLSRLERIAVASAVIGGVTLGVAGAAAQIAMVSSGDREALYEATKCAVTGFGLFFGAAMYHMNRIATTYG